MAYTPERISASEMTYIVSGGALNSTYSPWTDFTRNTPEDVVLGKEVPFGGLDYYISYCDPCISEPPFWGQILTGQFAAENRFNMGMLQYKLPLIFVVAP